MAREKGGGRNRVTIHAVAERAGVSAMTVSNVVNRRGNVGDATRSRVTAAIAALGYVPNISAKRLATADDTRIGLLYRLQQTPFLSEVLVGALEATSSRGVQLLIRGGDVVDARQAEAMVRTLARSGVRRMILVPPFTELLTGTGLFAELGVMVSGIATGGPLVDMHSVRIDDLAAAFRMTDHLIALGHRRIGIVRGPGTHRDSHARAQGYRAALAVHGLPVDPALQVTGDFTLDSGLAGGEILLAREDPPSAIFACNDDMAAGVMTVAHRRGIRIPEDLSVVGFDDTPTATRVWPAMTVVHQPIAAITAKAVEILLDPTLDHASAPTDCVMDYRLIERKSAGRWRDPD